MIRRSLRWCLAGGPIAVVVVGLCLVGAAPAAASSDLFSSFPGDVAVGFAPHPPTPGSEAEPAVCEGCRPPLLYRVNGRRVMGTSTAGEVTITPIYWDPSGNLGSSQYAGIINQYLTDIDAASGRTDNVFAINTDYYQVVGGNTSQIQYLLHAGSPINDTNSYPGGCPPHPGFAACVTDAEVRAELAADGVGTSLPADGGHLYMVFFPPGVDLTDSSGGYSDGGWCGIHGGYSGSGGPVFYALEPFPPASGCGAGQAPNGLVGADLQIGTMSHEINESITDPGGPFGQPWFDAAGNEIGDQCNQIYGPALGSTDPNNPQTTLYNQVINGHFYYTQESFSNNSFATFGVGQGCIQTAFVPQGSSGQTPEPSSPNQGLVNASPDVAAR